MKIKLSDIAEEMGLSVAAVSMAINQKKGVSDETREQVLKVANQMGYKFKKNKSHHLEQDHKKRFIKLVRITKHGLVVSDTAFFTQVIEGIEKQTKKLGYEFMISNISLVKSDPHQIMREYHPEVDGMIILCTELDKEDVSDLINPPCPITILDRKFDYSIDTILMNNPKAARQAVSYLIEMGHVQIGYLKSSTSIYNFESRFKSYRESIAANQLPLNVNHIFELEPTIEGAYRDMKEALTQHGLGDLPTAFLADNDIIAMGAMNAMKEAGIAIPEQVSVVGIDDMPFCTLVTPKLTTIRIFKEEIGREAAKMLAEKIEGHTRYSKTILVDTELVERESVARLTTR